MSGKHPFYGISTGEVHWHLAYLGRTLIYVVLPEHQNFLGEAFPKSYSHKSSMNKIRYVLYQLKHIMSL